MAEVWILSSRVWRAAALPKTEQGMFRVRMLSEHWWAGGWAGGVVGVGEVVSTVRY